MPTDDQTLAALAAASYSRPATVETADAHALIDERPNGTVAIACRGTKPTNWVDLWRDLGAIDRRTDPILGRVPATIIADVEQLAWRLWKLIAGRPIMITGHSKGGGEAQGLAAVMIHMGATVERLTTFAALRMGTLGGLIAALPGVDYCFASDAVPKAPPNELIPRVQTFLPWTKPATLDLFEYHYIENIAAALPAGGQEI